MRISPDGVILFEYGFFKINMTIAITWLLMLVMVGGSMLVTRKLSSNIQVSRWQSILEMVVIGIKMQIEEIGLAKAERHLSFLGSLFLFMFLANLFTVFPFYEPPTSSLSTTAALAICVFVAIPYYNIREYGLLNYLKSYTKPAFFMLPFHILSEFSRTLALAVRLFGNMMSGAMLVAILLTITPFLFPVVMSAFGLLTGSVQAYIFSILATVFIAAAAHESETKMSKQV